MADGQIRPLIGERLGLTDVADGIQRLADGSTVGRAGVRALSGYQARALNRYEALCAQVSG